MAGDKRPKRRCVKKQEGPSGAHYVGYVEDEETPEAIMRKFAIMEQAGPVPTYARPVMLQTCQVVEQCQCQ